MITIQKKVGDTTKAVNQTKDLAKIQLALFSIGILSKSAFKKEMLDLLLPSNSNSSKAILTSEFESISTKLNHLPKTSKQIPRSKIPLTIAAIRKFQKNIVGSSSPDGRIDPGFGTLKKLVATVKALPKPKPRPAEPTNVPTHVPDSFETGSTGTRIDPGNQVTQIGENIVINVSVDRKTSQKKISISKARSFITKSYNWNAIVKLMQWVYKKKKDTYVSPTNLKGLEDDDALIIPDLAIRYLVELQLAFKLKNTTLSTRNIKGILKSVDGLLGTGFFRDILKKDKLEYWNEMNNKSLKDISTNTKIAIPSIDDDERILYDFFRSVVHARNGLWSDNQGVVNIVGLRRALDRKSSTRYNDGIAVSWIDESGAKRVELNIATTEAGNRFSSRQLSPQTTTMVAGYHFLRQPAGRTRKLLIQKANSDAKKLKSYTWSGADSGMNFHQGGNKFTFPSNEWLKDFGLSGLRGGEPTRRFNKDQMFDLNILLSELLLVLSKYGGNKKVAAYQMLRSLAESKSMKIFKIKDGKVTVSQGREKRVLDIQEIKNWMVSYWYNKRMSESNRLKIFTIIERLSDFTKEEIEPWMKLSKEQVLEKIEDSFVIRIIEKQMLFFPKLSDIDGKGGLIFFNAIDGIRPSIEEAKTDLPIVNKLIAQLDNLPLTRIDRLKDKLQKLRIDSDTNRNNVKNHVRYDESIEANVIENATVGVWSKGCQVIYDTEVFYTFWTKLMKRAKASGQRRYYYTLIDATGWKKNEVI